MTAQGLARRALWLYSVLTVAGCRDHRLRRRTKRFSGSTWLNAPFGAVGVVACAFDGQLGGAMRAYLPVDDLVAAAKATDLLRSNGFQ